MRCLIVAVLAGAVFALPAFADAPPSHYDVTPLTKTDMELYLSVMRPAAAYVANPNAEDRAAIAYMKSNHGDPKPPEPPKMPDFGTSPPTQAQLAAMQKAMDDYNKKIQKPMQYSSRAAVLASYDDEIAKQRHVETQYDGIRNAVENAMAQIQGTGASCGGDDCGPTEKPTATQLALWKKEEQVAKANVAFVRPYAPEIVKLKKPLHDVMFAH